MMDVLKILKLTHLFRGFGVLCTYAFGFAADDVDFDVDVDIDIDVDLDVDIDIEIDLETDG